MLMKHNHHQTDLFGGVVVRPSLPTAYEPFLPAYFEVPRIYLAKGSLATPERRRFVERVCQLYPQAQVKEYLDVPHNRSSCQELWKFPSSPPVHQAAAVAS